MTAATILEQLWADHHDEVYFYIAKRTDLDTAEDLSQDVYLHAYESLAAGRGYTSSPRGWLFRMAHNRVIDFYRQRDGRASSGPRRPIMELSEAVETRITEQIEMPHEIVVQSMTHTALYKAIDGLSEPQRQVVDMHLDGWQQVDMCAPLQKKWQAVKQIKLRAINALRRNFARDLFMREEAA